MNRINPFTCLLFLPLALLPLWSSAQDKDTLAYQSIYAGTDSVDIEFAIRLDTLTPNGRENDPNLRPRYKVFVSYGDGTYENFVIYDEVRGQWTENSATKTAARNNREARITRREDSTLVFTFYHTYQLRPTRPVFTSVAGIKTTDTDPPPKRQVPIDVWTEAEENPPSPYTGEQKKIGLAMHQNISTRADQARYYAIGDSISDDTLHLLSQIAPVRGDLYNWIVEIRGLENQVVDSCTIFLHHNLGHFLPAGASFDFLDQDSVMAWRGEVVDSKSFKDFYGLTGPENTLPFSDVLELELVDLDTEEVRRFILPFRLSEDLKVDMENPEPVVFHGVAIDKGLREAFIQGVRDIGGDLFKVTVLINEVDNPDGSRKLREVTLPFFRAQKYAVDPKQSRRGSSAHSPGGDRAMSRRQTTQEVVVQPAERTEVVPRSHKLENSEAFQNLLDSLNAVFIDDDLQTDYLRDSHDPNAIRIEPDCLPNGDWVLNLTVDVENYGTLGATYVRIAVEKAADVFGSDAIWSIYDHTFGSYAQVRQETSVDSFVVTITNIYLPGMQELALESGEVIQGLSQDKAIQSPNRYHTLTQARLSLLVKTDNARLFPIPERFIYGNVVFDDAPPITMFDTIAVRPSGCSGQNYSRWFGWIRLGLNHGFPFSIYENNWALVDNLTLGIAGQYRPGLLPISLQGELNYNRWSFDGSDNTQLQYTGLETALLLNFDLADRLRLGLGAAYHWNTNWEVTGSNLATFHPKAQFFSALLDLNAGFLNNSLRAGLRGYAHFNAIRLKSTNAQHNLYQAQLYLAYRLPWN